MMMEISERVKELGDYDFLELVADESKRRAKELGTLTTDGGESYNNENIVALWVLTARFND